jgi:alpha-tubulin suppressor-like RCC1 family protein
MPNFSGVWNLKEQIQAVAAGTWTGIVFSELYSWGNGGLGQLGHNNTTSLSSPVQVGSLSDWAQASAGTNNSACVKIDGTLFTWGDNTSGQLGHNDVIVRRSSPVQVGALTNWAQVSVNTNFMACVTTAGTLFTWGVNASGQLGHNDVIARSSPVQVGALTDWAQVAAGATHTACVKTDGTIWTWGNAARGALGQNNATSLSSPVQVGALTNWAQVAAGSMSPPINGAHTACVKTDGTLFTWGNNDNGQLGDGTVVYRSSPVQVGALTNWAQVSAGLYNTACVKTDGTLFTWGNNNNGQLGNNNGINLSSPVQVGALTNWAQVASAISPFSACVKTDGTLFMWGSNNQGQLGDGTITSRSSPVQVGALTNWAQVAVARQTLAVFQGTTN